MVSPINGDKPITVSTEQTGKSTKNRPNEPTANAPSSSLEGQVAEPVGTTLEVDKARRLYDLENQTSRIAGAEITTPEAARSLLEEILAQFKQAPEQAVKSQGSQGDALANLLQTAPT